jgi:NAD+ kinase
MLAFDGIMITHKPEPDEKTLAIIDSVHSYAKCRNVALYDNVNITYDDSNPTSVLIVSIGGDGTMLNAMRMSTYYPDATIVGFNTGTLGFLTEEIPEKIFEYLDGILFEKDMFLESRMLLSGQVTVDGEEQEGMSFIAANEFVLTAAINAPLVTDVFINEQFVGSQLGSGMLVSSSTGSTAMSLSSGGAIVSPSTKIMQIVPLLAHTLTARPIITTGNDKISMEGELTERVEEINIHADGNKIFSLTSKNYSIGCRVGIVVERSSNALIWRPKDWNFFNVLTEKMKW